MEIEKICRCCMALSGPLLSIYDGGSAGGGCVADMLKEIAKLKPQPKDNMPEKACLQCISEINRCFMFKVKCENSNRTLRQLLPEAIKEHLDDTPKEKVSVSSIAVQTEEKVLVSSLVQTLEEEKPLVNHKEIQTTEEEKAIVHHREVQTEYEVELSNNLSVNSKTKKFNEDVEDFIIYEHVESPERKRKKATKTSPASQKQISASNKEQIIENNEENITSIELPIQRQEAYILLEDSNCSQEPELYIESTLENPQDQEGSIVANDRFDYYTNENGEETEEVSDNDQSIVYPDDEYINPHNVQPEECEYEINSSEEISKPSQAAIELLKKLKSTKPKGLFKCSECIMTFFSIKVLRRHLANRHNIKNMEIVVEDLTVEALTPKITEIEEPSSSENSAILRSGLELTLENVPKPQLLPRAQVTSSVNEETLNQLKYHCEYCQAGFAQSKTLAYHIKHNICMTNNFKCNICERMFVSEESLDAHKETHNNQHKCLECDKVCKTVEDLSKHMIKEHNRNARNQCHICKKVFTMKTSLNDHLRIHSGEKPFLCTVCGKSFRQNSNLRQHLLRHTNEKNFKCDMCTNSYVTKAELFSHKRTHTGDQPYKCDECSACFTTSCSLQKHKRKHTGERPYACEYCPMRFAALNVLKNHRRTHTGEKPFKCSYCDKSFTQRGDCLMHQRTHVNTAFKCFCGSKFTKKSNFKHHVKTQHPNLTEKQVNYLIDKTKNENNAELQVTLLQDDDDDIVDGGCIDETSQYATVDNEDDEDSVVLESLNEERHGNEELMHIVMEDVI